MVQSVTDTTNNQSLKRCLIINLDNTQNKCNVWDTDSAFNFNNQNLLNQFINANILTSANANLKVGITQIKAPSTPLPSTPNPVTKNPPPPPLPQNIQIAHNNIISTTIQQKSTTLPSKDQVQTILSNYDCKGIKNIISNVSHSNVDFNSKTTFLD
jgi:hypothetical protein